MAIPPFKFACIFYTIPLITRARKTLQGSFSLNKNMLEINLWKQNIHYLITCVSIARFYCTFLIKWKLMPKMHEKPEWGSGKLWLYLYYSNLFQIVVFSKRQVIAFFWRCFLLKIYFTNVSCFICNPFRFRHVNFIYNIYIYIIIYY